MVLTRDCFKQSGTIRKMTINVSFYIILLFVFLNSALAENAGITTRIHTLTHLLLEQSLSSDEVLVEGFSKKVSGEGIIYHSPVLERLPALLSRATDGHMKISWKTAIVPEDQGNVSFVWLAGLGSNLGEKEFKLFVNGDSFFNFTTSPKPEWTIKGREKSSLSFKASYKDAVGDLFGLMILKIPGRFFKSGQPLELSVIGEAGNSNAWYMTFEYDRIAAAIEKTKKDGFWYRLIQEKGSESVSLNMPLSWAGRTIRIGNNDSYILREEESVSRVELPVKSLEPAPVEIFLDGTLLDEVPHFSEKSTGMILYDNGKTVYRTWDDSGNEWILEVSASFISGITDDIIELSRGPMSGATLELITSSHQDIAWMDDPMTCKIMRDTMVITPALELLRKNPEYHYSAEQALMLYEYLDRHPESLSEIQKFSAEGRLEWGASFNQPYEGMYFGESLIRQFYFGRKWLKETLPGYDPKVYFNVDVPGRTTQMPQIACKSGVDYMIISRHGQGYFYWRSPDGSQVAVHTPGHYHQDSEFLRHSVEEAIMNTPNEISKRQENIIAHRFPQNIPILFSSDMSSPVDMNTLFDTWSNIHLISNEDKTSLKTSLPKWRYNTFQPVLKTLFDQGTNLSVLEGERPNVWLYIHGPTHHRAISASRAGGRLLPVAETFSTIAALLGEDWKSYPAQELRTAWEAQIYPDHGWGGKDGHITDQLFKEKSEFSRNEAKRIIGKTTRAIKSYIRTDPDKGKALIVFNPLSWKRDAVLKTKIQLDQGEMKNFEMVNGDGKKIDSKINVLDYHSDGTLNRVELIAFIEDIPSVGYKTVYFKGKANAIPNQGEAFKTEKVFDNRYYRITFDKGGIKSLYDKELQHELVNSETFLFGELFALKSEGNGAGEFDKPQLPTPDYFERMNQYKPEWHKIAENDLYTTFELRQTLRNSAVLERIIIYNTLKRIDFEIDILGWDGTKSREYRLAFPLNQKSGKITYEVPFAKITVGEDEIPGAAGERYTQIASELHPREVLDWISSSDETYGVTLSSDVAVWDYIDLTGEPVEHTLLQPVLLATRKSCHWEGNWYLQEGDHHYRFSLTSHAPGWQNGYRFGKASNFEVHSVLSDGISENAILPEAKSFLEISDENVLLSTIKKAEDSDDVVVRFYETEGKDTAFKFSWFKPVKNRIKINLIEEADPYGKEEPDSKEYKIDGYGIETWKIFD